MSINAVSDELWYDISMVKFLIFTIFFVVHSSAFDEADDAVLITHPIKVYAIDPDTGEPTDKQIVITPGEVVGIDLADKQTKAGWLWSFGSVDDLVRIELEDRADYYVSLSDLKQSGKPYVITDLDSEDFDDKEVDEIAKIIGELENEDIDEIGLMLQNMGLVGKPVTTCDPHRGLKKEKPSVMKEFKPRPTERPVTHPEWLDKYVENIYFETGGKAGGQFEPLSNKEACQKFNKEICAIYPRVFKGPMTKDRFLFVKAIIQQESGHDAKAFRWEDRNFRNARWLKKHFKTYQKDFPGEDLKAKHKIYREVERSLVVVGKTKQTKITTYLTVINEKSGKKIVNRSLLGEYYRKRWKGDKAETKSSQHFVAAHPESKKFEASYGPMQVLYATARFQHGFKDKPKDLFKPCEGIKYGLKHLKYNFDRAQRIKQKAPASSPLKKYRVRALVAASYNSGGVTLKKDKNNESYLSCHKNGEGEYYYQAVARRAKEIASECKDTINIENVCGSFNKSELQEACR